MMLCSPKSICIKLYNCWQEWDWMVILRWSGGITFFKRGLTKANISPSENSLTFKDLLIMWSNEPLRSGKLFLMILSYPAALLFEISLTMLFNSFLVLTLMLVDSLVESGKGGTHCVRVGHSCPFVFKLKTPSLTRLGVKVVIRLTSFLLFHPIESVDVLSEFVPAFA